MAVEQALAQFKETEGGEAFRLQNSKLLKVELAGVEIQAKLGSMVAYQRRELRARRLRRPLADDQEGGHERGRRPDEGLRDGEIFLADMAQDIQLLRLEDEAITANGPHVLAFDAGIDWDIKRVEGASGALSGGLYNMELFEPATSPWSPTDRRCSSRSTARARSPIRRRRSPGRRA